MRPRCGRTWALRLVRHRQHDRHARSGLRAVSSYSGSPLSLTSHHERTYIHMTNRNGAHDEDCDMLVIGSGLGGSVVALQLTKKRYRTGLLAAGRRSPDEHFAEAAWDIKRFACAPLGLKGTRRILWLPRVVIHAGFGVVGCSRVLQRIRNSRLSTNCDGAASTDSESLPGPSRPLRPRVAPWRPPTRSESRRGGSDQGREHRRSGRPFCKSLLARHSQQAEPIPAAVVGGTRMSEEGNAAVRSGFLGRRGTKQPK